MELMTKYEYTYFIYPYVIDSNRYSRYIQKLLKNKKCKLRIFEKEKDMHLYQYFLPNIREYMFWSFGLNKDAIKAFNSLDVSVQANLLERHDCNIFQYELPKDLQGKIGEKDGIFFDISEIKIVCFKTGICFLLFKTSLPANNSFNDILNFNYKFREVNSKTYSLKEYENIKLQSDIFKDVKEVSLIIKEITGDSSGTKKINLDDEKFIVYSYCCLDQSLWNEETKNDSIDNVFKKYRSFLPSSKQVADAMNEKDDMETYENKYIRYGFSNTGTVLLTTDVNTPNYTTVPQKFESEYLYTYILELYKKILLNKLSNDFNKTGNFKTVEIQFLEFTKRLWIQDITDDEFGKILSKQWERILDIEEVFLKLKNKYDILYKKYNIEKTSDKNCKLVVVVVIMIVIGIINMLLILSK